MKKILGTVAARVGFTADTSPCVFSGPIAVDQVRGDTDPPLSKDVAVTFNRDVFDAVAGRVRWTGSRLLFDGGDDQKTIILGRGMGAAFEESIDANEQATLRFQPCGVEWGIPSTDYVPPTPSTCPVSIPVVARKSPRSHGNKPVEFYLRLGASPGKMIERKLFQGQTLSKSNRGTILPTGDINSVDDSTLYANVPLCLSVPPFSGMRRDEVVRLAAESVGLDPVADVICPIGKVITKPILLTNASLVPFVNELGVAENWRAFFNADGKLEVQVIERKDAPDLPDWELDASQGDFDLDSLEETPPSQPATRIVVQVSQPVQGTGPDGSGLEVTTRTTEKDYELYAPECVKVRPSGASSYLYGDGSYRSLSEEALMLVQKKVTDVTTVNGQETRRTVTIFQFYNPRAWDPNFDVYPPTSSYDGAYGNKTFHRDEVETMTEVSYISVDTTRDIYGTILGTVQVEKSWYAPHRGLTFQAPSRSALLGDAGATPPSYIYAGGTSRVLPVEQYLVTEKVEKVYQYASDGTLASILETTSDWLSPESRCDITVNDDDNTDQIPDDPPFETPPPSPPPSTNPAFHPALTGPVGQSGGVFTFKMSIAGAAGATTGGATFGFWATPASSPPPTWGSNGGTPLGHVLSVPAGFDPTTSPDGYATIQFSGPKPVFSFGPAIIYGAFYVFIGGVKFWSNALVFDPWQNVPPGGSL